MSRSVLLVATLLLLAGCTATPGAEPASDATTTPVSTDPSPTAADATPTTDPGPRNVSIPEYTAQKRAIGAEKDRIRAALSDRKNLTDLSFGILRPAAASTVSRNKTAVTVAVTVGYSVSFERCSLDGAATETRYLVTENRTRLLALEQDVTDARGC